MIEKGNVKDNNVLTKGEVYECGNGEDMYPVNGNAKVMYMIILYGKYVYQKCMDL